MLPLPPGQWAERTFGCADLGDKRRTKRLVHTAADLSAHMGSSLAESCEGNLASVEGGYRLIENEAVDPEAIAEAGFQATARASEDSEPILLALEDSTTLGYKHSARSELGDLGGSEDSRIKGFWAHSVILLDAETERTFGLIDNNYLYNATSSLASLHRRSSGTDKAGVRCIT